MKKYRSPAAGRRRLMEDWATYLAGERREAKAAPIR